MRFLIPLALSLVAAAASGAEPIAKQNPVKAGGFATVTLKLEKGESAIFEISPDPVEEITYETADLVTTHFSGLAPSYAVTAWVTNFETRKQYKRKLIVSFAQNPQPPPRPDVDPKPKPDVDPVPPPKPIDPVKSFRVVMVFESGKRLPAKQEAVATGAEVEKWLNANCTGGKAGWRTRDPNSPGDGDPAFAKLWDFIVTSGPKKNSFLAVERNDVVTFIDITDPATVLAEFAKIREGK